MEQSELQAIWEQILQKVLEQRSLTELALNDWLRPVKPLSLSDTTLVLGAPTSLAREWIVKRYIPFLEDAVLDIAKKKLLKASTLYIPLGAVIQLLFIFRTILTKFII